MTIIYSRDTRCKFIVVDIVSVGAFSLLVGFDNSLTADPVHNGFLLFFIRNSVVNGFHIPHDITEIHLFALWVVTTDKAACLFIIEAGCGRIVRALLKCAKHIRCNLL